MDRSDGRILVLFDIDGTLVLTHGAGVRGMARAFEELHGIPNALDGVAIAGRTDRAIIADGFARAGLVPTEDSHRRLRDSYVRHLDDELASSEVEVLPGVGTVLDTLARDRRFTVALLTGNFAEGARLKLRAAGIWERFRFGAYGDDSVDRRALVPVALARAAEVGVEAGSVVVVGDTPLDVDCAHANGVAAIAVATGTYDAAALRATGAELVVETLEALTPAARALDKLCRTTSKRAGRRTLGVPWT